MSLGNTVRNAVGTEKHLLLSIDEVLNGVTGIKTETVAFTGHPASFLQITPANGVNAAAVGSGKDYPDQNATLPSQAGMTTSQVKLDAGATSVDVIGLMIVITSGTGIGQVRLITGYASLTATVHRAWDVQPATSDGYLLLIPTYRLSRLMIKPEFDTAKASAPSALIEVALYDCPPVTGTDLAAKFTRAPVRYADVDLNLDNKGHTSGATIGAYYHGRVRTIDCAGSLGARVRVVTAPATGKISIWGSAT